MTFVVSLDLDLLPDDSDPVACKYGWEGAHFTNFTREHCDKNKTTTAECQLIRASRSRTSSIPSLVPFGHSKLAISVGLTR